MFQLGLVRDIVPLFIDGTKFYVQKHQEITHTSSPITVSFADALPLDIQISQ